MADVRATLQSSLASARRNVEAAQPKLVNPPRPSLNQVRRVARVEEIDPVALATRNEQMLSRIPDAAAGEPPETTAPHLIQRKVDNGESGTIEPPETPLSRSAGTPVQRRIESPNQSADDSSVKSMPAQINRPTLQRAPAASVNRGETQMDAPYVAQPTGPNGEYTPLQRMRQVRASQAQRAQAAPKPIASPPPAESISQPRSEGRRSEGGEGRSEDAPATPSEPSSPVIRRKISEMDAIQPASTPEVRQPVELADSAVESSAANVAPQSVETPRSAQLPLSAESPQLAKSPQAAPLQRKVTMGPTEEVVATPPVISAPPVQRKQEVVDDVPAAPQPHMQVESANPTISSDPPVVTEQHTDTVQRKLVERQTPSHGDTDNTNTVESAIEPPPAQPVTQRKPAGHTTFPPQPASQEPESGAPSAHVATEPETFASLSTPPPESIQRSHSEKAPSFEAHTIARAEQNLTMPLTQRPLARRPAIQRTTDTAPASTFSAPQSGEPPVARSVDTQVTRSAETSVMRSVEPLDTLSFTQPAASDGDSVSPAGLPALQRSMNAGQDAGAAEVESSEPLQNVKPQVRQAAQRRPASAIKLATQPGALPLRMPAVQRGFDRSVPSSGPSPLEVVLPQVREAAGAETQAAVGEHQIVTGTDFRVQRSNTPAMARTSEATALSMPLLQRSVAPKEPPVAPRRDPEIEIKRLSAPESKPSLVLRKPLTPEKVSKDADADVRRELSTDDASTPRIATSEQASAPTQVIRPNIDQLAVAIMPLIKRMLVVERERQRGL